MLLAQAKSEGIKIVSHDRNISGAGHLNDAPSGRGRLATREVGNFLLTLPADDAVVSACAVSIR